MSRESSAGTRPTGAAHLLVAVDRGAASAAAVRMGGRVSRALGGRVSILHVSPAGTTPQGPEPPERAAQLELAALGVDAAVVVRGGDPVDEIVAAARSLGVDLLLMGSRGRTSLGGLLLGSVSQEVVSRASCPVLLVRADADTAHAPRSILLAVEGLEGSAPLVGITARLAKALKATVTAVHVSYPGGEELERSLYHAQQTHGEQAVAWAVAQLLRQGIQATSMQMTARSGISRALAGCADAVGTDLIVMGAHPAERRGEGARAELSTAVSHRTNKPVLVTPERPDKP